MKKWIFRGFSLLLLLTFFYFLFACGKKKVETKFIAASRGDIQEKALAVGTIEPEKEIKVKSTIPGIVAEVMFKVGDPVKAGAPLFKISPNPTPLEYVESRRAMELADVTMQKLKSDWTRQLELYKGNLISRSEMDATEGLYKEAELRYRTSAERFELLEKGRIRMSNREIDSLLRSPISGIIMASLLFKGTVDEIDVGKIVEGMDAEIQIGALPDTKFPGRVERIFPKAKKEGNATLFDIWIVIKDAARVTLRAGFSATASIQIQARKQVVLLPERLILFEEGKKLVEIPDGEKTKKVEVRTGLSDGLHIEILDGLKEGDKVVERPPREIK
jgi:HlyD family secretion protein